MGAGTFTFNRWLGGLEAALGTGTALQKMQRLAAEAHQAFGAVIWFAEILGRRWSYIAGQDSDGLPAASPCKIPMGPGLGLVCASWGTMTPAQQAAFVALIKRQMLPEPWGTSS